MKKLLPLIIFFAFSLNLFAQTNQINQTNQPQKEKISYRFVIYGDTRTDHKIHRQIVDKIVKLKPAFVVNTGDLVNNGNNNKDWVQFENIVAAFKYADISYYAVPGNHENNSEYFYQRFNLPQDTGWYSFENRNSCFILLDSNKSLEEGSVQNKWLLDKFEELSIRSNNKPDFIFVIFHHPLYSSGRHGSELGLREILVPIFNKYGVDAVFNGHDHIYERSVAGNITYVVAGGGGAPLYEKDSKNEFSEFFKKEYHYVLAVVDDKKVKFVAIGVDNSIIDSFEIDKTK